MYRNLTLAEIETLQERGCYAKDWSKVEVKNGEFKPQRYSNVRFSGSVKLGLQDSEIELTNGITTLTGIKNVLLHDTTIGDNVYINNITQYIANYTIGDNVVINNIDSLIASKGASFGNGTEISVLNETGGRDVPIYDNISSQLAYIMALYRHREVLIERLKELVDSYIEEVKKGGAIIGKQTTILNCGEIIDVKIGEGAYINGASKLVDGSINSTLDAPTVVGRSVIAEHFIFCNSSKVIDGSIIDRCFVGQGTEIGKQYSAENSLFFANCVAMHGEACAVFAAPYTVTHHKSTLLIATMCSFMNAGSGSNQSNHMYKLGPIHQGILERGSKTTSGSYVLWPMKIGAFSLVMGRHYNNADLSDMPFSYIIEDKGSQSIIVPGVNLRSVGTIRDAKKWPNRDKRKGEKRYDQINFNLLSPYTIDKMFKGEKLLKDMFAISGESSEKYSYQSCVIKNSSAKNGLKLYDAGITKFLGNSLIHRLKSDDLKSIEDIRERLKPSTSIGEGDWCDIAGLICPKSEIAAILNKIESRELSSLEAIESEFKRLNDQYYEYEWTWAVEKLCSRIGKSIDQIEICDIVDYAKRWKECVLSLDRALYDDARKEFNLITTTSFGVDGDSETKKADFVAVRGDFDSNDFVKDVLTHIEKKSRLGEQFIERMNNIKSNL